MLVLNKQPTKCLLRVFLSPVCLHICVTLKLTVYYLYWPVKSSLIDPLHHCLAYACEVTFDSKCCTVWYNGTIILQGKKDLSTDLWTLPLGMPSTSTHHGAAMTPLVAPVISDAHAHPATMQVAFFTHMVQNKANSIWFAYQALCSLRISTLLNAIRRGYLKGCPNLTAHRVSKYLNPSPATAKGHMKQPHQGIQHMRRVLTPATTHKLLQVPPIKPTKHNDVDLIPLDKTSTLTLALVSTAWQRALPLSNPTKTPKPTFSVLTPLLINTWEFYTRTWPALFCSCPSMGTSAFLLCITTNQMQFWHFQLQTSATTASLPHTLNNMNSSNQKGSQLS